jgi:hypothetical protein
MVGSDDEEFKDLARETKLPEERRDACAGDYSNAAYSWDLVLEPHRRAPDQPKANIDVIYGPTEGRTSTAQQVAQSIRLLETVAEHAADRMAGAFHIGNAKLRLSKRPLGSSDPQTYSVLRTCLRIRRPLSHLCRRARGRLGDSGQLKT